MGAETKIQWCDHTFNHVRGCTKVSPGCARCYADAQSKRNPGVLGVWGPNGSRVVASESKWREPLAWDREAREAGERRRVFCASLADVFEDWRGPMVDSAGNVLHYNSAATWWVPHENPHGPIPMDFVRVRLFGLIDATPNLDWLVLTKRPENVIPTLERLGNRLPMIDAWLVNRDPPPNVWLGVSAEDQARADERIPILLGIPAAVRFVSAEPLLGPIDFGRWLGARCPGCDSPSPELHPAVQSEGEVQECSHPYHDLPRSQPRPMLDQIIAGGESGPGARPCDIAWLRSIRDQCKAAGVACFVKQLGSSPRPGPRPSDMAVRYVRDPKGGDWSEWPADLRVREFPAVSIGG